MLRVGLTGGYATGKTLVASQFAALGCRVIYADELGHAVLEPGREAYAPVIEQFGPGILRPDGTIDRKKLGSIVFPAPEKLEALTAIVHPAVYRLEEQLLETASEQDPEGIAIVEAAILIETGRYRSYDRVVLTTCNPETQIARAMARDGASREQALARIARQWPFERKRDLASYIVDTSGTKDVTSERVHDIHRELLALARH
jgi:dephospho-CoA kinase